MSALRSPASILTAAADAGVKLWFSAAYLKFKQAASRFSLVGVFVAQTDGGVRVAITGAATSVFRHAGLEAALNQSFTPASAAAVKIDASELNSDIHASAAYRANLISVQTQRAVAQLVG